MDLIYEHWYSALCEVRVAKSLSSLTCCQLWLQQFSARDGILCSCTFFPWGICHEKRNHFSAFCVILWLRESFCVIMWLKLSFCVVLWLWESFCVTLRHEKFLSANLWQKRILWCRFLLQECFCVILWPIEWFCVIYDALYLRLSWSAPLRIDNFWPHDLPHAKV